MDTFSAGRRSQIMAAIKGRNTTPELIVRRYLHAKGLRYTLHDNALPGCPDIIFRNRRVAVFVHGCFWHGHDCKRGRLPKSRLDYWSQKIARNKQRDSVAVRRLRRLGWRVIIVRECALKEPRLERIYKFITTDD